MVRDIYILEFLAMFLVWLVVTVVYHLTTGGAWRRSPEGRLLMADGVLFVWVTGLVLTSIVFPDYPGHTAVGIVSYALFVGTGLWRLRLIVRAQRWKRRQAAKRQHEAGLTARRGPHPSDVQHHAR